MSFIACDILNIVLLHCDIREILYIPRILLLIDLTFISCFNHIYTLITYKVILP